MRKIIYIPLFSILLIGLTFQACKKNDVEIDFRYGYFGLEEGKYVDYEVTEILHDDPVQIHDTVKYELRAFIGDTVIDNEGRIARKYFRAIKNEETGQFEIKDVWTALIDNYKAELIEENQRVIKLVFAPTDDKVWNRNAFNMFEQKDCYYDYLHQPVTLNGINYPTTLRVEIENSQNLIEYKRNFETYAEGIGMINLFKKDFESLISGDTLKPKIGTELHMRAIAHGTL